MADENVNVPDSGDVLGQVTGSSTNPDSRTLKSIDSKVSSIDSSVQDLNRSFSNFVRQNFGTSARTFSARYEDESYSRRQSSRSSSSSTSSSAFKSSASKGSNGSALDDFLNGFEEQLSEYLGIPYLGDDVSDTFRKVSDNFKRQISSAFGLSYNDFARELGKVLTKDGVEKFTKNFPQLSGQLKQFADWYTGGIRTSLENASEVWDEAIRNGIPDKEKAEKLTSKNLFNTQSGGRDSRKTPESSDSVRSYPSNRAQSSGYPSNQLDVLYVDQLIFQNLSSKFGNAGSNPVGSNDGSGSSILDSQGNPISSKFNDDIKDTVVETMSDSAVQAVTSGDVTSLLTGVQAVGTQLTAMIPQLAATAAAAYVVNGIVDQFEKFISRIGSAAEKIGGVADRYDKSRWAEVDAQERRFQQDIETYIKHPFQVLEDAANKVYEVWDSALQTITATQGYDKAGLQDLMSAYASRLRSEGLGDVVGTIDVTSMLQQILNAGLSGAVAEEFAYQATVLNKAIPTEDFTSYASAYASLASSYIAAGYSQEEALKYANDQLQVFASNVLTASREISGGLTTSLTNVSGLFEDIVKIAQTAGVSDTSNLSSALSIVEAIGGQVSPDVGNQLVNQIVQAAVGGNDTNLVALRSLAGTGASNTAFLQALAKNPNQVLANLFSGLSDMFDKSTDNYMEVAYSLADTFGVSADALARINWDGLVEALRNNSSSTSALNQNMALLESGETTTSAESQRIAQINQYMIDEGLSYVLDNEAARSIQEHMWDQEIAQQMQEATYSVDLAGAGLELLKSIESFVAGIVNVLTLGLVNVGQVGQTYTDYQNLLGDLKQMLEAGKVGSGNATQYHDLTTYDVNALSQYFPDELDLWGKQSFYRGTNSPYQEINGIYSQLNTGADMPDSKYTWGNVGKSYLDSMGTVAKGVEDLVSNVVEGQSTVSQSISQQTASQLQSWLETMGDFINNKGTFSDWYNTASDFGFSDVESTLSDMGYSTNDLQNMYVQEATNAAVQEQSTKDALEQQFYQEGVTWITQTYPTDRDAWNTKYDTNVSNWMLTYTTQMTNWSTLYTSTMQTFTEHLDLQYASWTELYTEYTEETQKQIKRIQTQFDESFVNDFLYEWKDYYIGNHTHYREATNFDSAIRTINAEKSQTGESVLALAQSLTTQYQDLADPQVQTNVLLGQILIVLQSILTAQTSGKGLTLPTALASLGLNITGTQSNG